MIMRRYGWLLGAIAVVLVAAVMIRLGFWQLDRLAQRRALNTRVERALSAPPLLLDPATAAALGNEDPATLEFRRVVVRGVFDHSQEILLMSRSLGGRPGYHIVTPLHVDGSDQAVLVDRGWVPLDRREPEMRSDLHEPGIVEVQGIIRLSQQPGRGLGPSDPPLRAGETRRDTWFYVTVERIQQQVSHPLLPIYIERETAPAALSLPVPSPQIQLSEGSHLSYAIQWFSFTTILIIGYVTVYVKHRRRRVNRELALPEHASQEPLAGR